MSEIESRSVVGDASEGEARLQAGVRMVEAAIQFFRESDGSHLEALQAENDDFTYWLDGMADVLASLRSTRAALEEASERVEVLTRHNERLEERGQEVVNRYVGGSKLDGPRFSDAIDALALAVVASRRSASPVQTPTENGTDA